MSVTTNQQAAIEKPHVIVAYFVQFDFAGGVGRFSTFNQTVTWNGFEWLGIGSMGDISAIEESDGVESQSLTFALNATFPELLSLAAGDVAEYRGREAKMYMCPLNSGYQLIDDPQQCWRGTMDTVAIGIGDDGAGKIQLKCETSAHGLLRPSSLRMNAAQQKLRHPTDTGFDYLSDLISNKQLWLSLKFQKQ